MISASNRILEEIEKIGIGKSPNTVRSYKRYWNHFAAYLDVKRIDSFDELTSGQIKAFLADYTVSSHTRNVAIAAIRILLDHMDEIKGIEVTNLSNIIRKVKYEGKGGAVKLWLPMSDIKRAIDNTYVLYNSRAVICRNVVILRLMAETMIRCSEITAMQLKDIHPESCLIDIRGKGGYYSHGVREVTSTLQASPSLIDNILEYVVKWRETSALDQDSKKLDGKSPALLFTSHQNKGITDRCVYSICSKAVSSVMSDPIKNHGPHCIRRSVARHLLISGAKNIVEIKKMLRHSRIDTTMIYLDMNESDL